MIRQKFEWLKNFGNLITEFIFEEKLIFFGFFVPCLLIIFFYIFTIETKELFNYGAEIFNFFYNLSIAIFIGIVFYFLQVFYPKRNIRLIANRDINFLINSTLHSLFYSIFQHYASRELTRKNSSKQNIYNKEYAELIAKKLKIDEIIKWKWNKNKKIWSEEINEVVIKFDIE